MNLKKLVNGKTWNARPFNAIKPAVPRATNNTEFTGAWINYLDENDEWQEIDTSFVDSITHFSVDKAPFEVEIPKFSDEVAKFIVNNRFDVHKKEKIVDPSLTQTIKALGVDRVAGQIKTGDFGWGVTNYILFPNAYSSIGADLIYWVHHGRAPRLRKLVRFHSKPSTDLRLEFEIEYSSDVDIKQKSGKTTLKRWDKIGKLKTKKAIGHKMVGSISRGISFKDFTMWDSGVREDLTTIPVDVEYEKLSGNLFKLTKILLKSDFDNLIFPVYTDASSTFNPDADAETSSVDGRAYERDSGGDTWTSLVTGPGSVAPQNDAAVGVLIRSYTVIDKYEFCDRTFLLFDTSALPDGDTINSATIGGHVSSIDDGFNGGEFDRSRRVYVASLPATDTELVAGDYDSVGIVSFGETDIMDDTVDEAYEDVALNSSGLTDIDNTGISKFALIIKFDFDDNVTDLTWASGVNQRVYIKTAENGTNIPRLIVDHGDGPGTLKTWNTLTVATVKTRNKIAIAKVKTANTLT